MKDYESRGFLIKQRAFIKAYLIHLIDRQKDYGWNYLEEIREVFQPYGFNPTATELYRCLHELVEDGILYRIKKRKEDSEYQEVVLYKFTDDGWQKGKLYKQQVKTDLDRSMGLLKKAVKDMYT